MWQRLKRLGSVWKDWRFYFFFVLFVVIGVGIRFLPADVQQQVCAFYEGNIEKRIDRGVRETLANVTLRVPAGGATATSDAATTTAPSDSADSVSLDQAAVNQISGAMLERFRHYVCAPEEGLSWEQTVRRREFGLVAQRALAVMPVSMVVSAILVSLFPRSVAKITPAAPTRSHTSNEPSHGRGSGADTLGGEGGTRKPKLLRLDVPDYLVGPSRDDTDLHLRSRQLRTAIRYAALSGAITVVAPPAFGEQAGLLTVTAGVALLAFMSLCLGFWSAAVFAELRMSWWELSSKTAFGGVFVGGVIALCIMMPYQILNPATSTLWGRDQVLRILLVRLFILPAVAFLGGCVALAYFRPGIGSTGSPPAASGGG